ncbi:oligoendopeptidase F [Mycoplasma wenyonii str. Massachusetts]|uniref:Oligoendopeptidase F n=1 Tax=Mycoplasma wenyonii (strain Massachusetts) TaxID=1197325 RepID=I6ZEP3_MYCWM|nr:M3 family metallopeptidase [Mycoplasma wenyonii]AFN65067.1 oligoendopeptidase F [Mycoplasma wenyonii str. Massachusetts]
MGTMKWDLNEALEGKSLEEWTSELERLQAEILKKYSADLFKNLNELIEFHRLFRELDIVSSRIGSYLSNNKNTDLTNPEWFIKEQEFVYKTIPFSQALSSFQNYAIQNKKTILSFYSDPKFAHLKREYESLFRYQSRRLPAIVAKYEATKAPLSSAFYEIFNILSEKDFLLKDIPDSEGNTFTIGNYAEYIKHMKKEDSIFRKNLFTSYVEFLDQKKESLHKLLYYQFLAWNIGSKNISFKDGYTESALYADEVPNKLLLNLYKYMKEFQPDIQKFRNIRRAVIEKVWNLDKFQEWDGYLELKAPSGKQLTFEIEETKNIVLTALKVLGPRYIDSLNLMFNSNWIDWMPNPPHKISGAYFTGGAYRLKGKYVLLNYNGYFDDLLTVAHELGHAVHDIEIDKTDTYYYSPTIFVAEIPSILNEILVQYHLLEKYKKEGDKFKQFYILDHLLSTFVSTSSVQLGYSEWEYNFNERIAKNQYWELEESAQAYSEIVKSYVGESPTEHPELRRKSLYRIFSIPHFYSGILYVYKYAVGMLTSVLLAERIMNESEREKALSDYFNFLSAGDSLSNLELLKSLSVNFLIAADYRRIHQIFKKWLSEYERLGQELYGVQSRISYTYTCKT